MVPDLHSRSLVFPFFLSNPANPQVGTIINTSTKQVQIKICINDTCSLTKTVGAMLTFNAYQNQCAKMGFGLNPTSGA